MLSIFSDTGVNTFPKKKPKTSIKTEMYKVKINICAHRLKETFGFQKNTNSKVQQQHPQCHHHRKNNTVSDRIFMQQKAAVMNNEHETTSLMMLRGRWVDRSTHTQQAHTLTAELKALLFPISDLQTPEQAASECLTDPAATLVCFFRAC